MSSNQSQQQKLSIVDKIDQNNKNQSQCQQISSVDQIRWQHPDQLLQKEQSVNKPTFINKLIVFSLMILLLFIIILGVKYMTQMSILQQQKNKSLQNRINQLKQTQYTLNQQITKSLQQNQNKIISQINLSLKHNYEQIEDNLKQNNQEIKNSIKNNYQSIKHNYEQLNNKIKSIKIPVQQIYTSSVQQSQKINFLLSPTSNVSAVFTTCCGRQLFLQLTLRSFAKYNTYPLKKLIIVNDGQLTLSLINILKKIPNIILLNTLQKVGQIISVDQAYKHVDTPYVYHSEDDWEMIKQGVIQENIQMLEKDQKILMLWNQWHKGDPQKGKKIQENIRYAGFSFNPSVNRMQLYRKLPGGYKQLTKNSSYGKGAGRAQINIMKYYKEQGYYVWMAKYDYFKHLGTGKGNPR